MEKLCSLRTRTFRITNCPRVSSVAFEIKLLFYVLYSYDDSCIKDKNEGYMSERSRPSSSACKTQGLHIRVVVIHICSSGDLPTRQRHIFPRETETLYFDRDFVMEKSEQTSCFVKMPEYSSKQILHISWASCDASNLSFRCVM